MKGKTVEVAPFDSFTYTLVNRYTKERFGPFDSILEAKDRASIICSQSNAWNWYDLFSASYYVNSTERWNYLVYKVARDAGKRTYFNMRAPFLIINQYGDIVPVVTIRDASGPYKPKNYEPRRRYAFDTVSSRVKVKGDGNKIKSDWSVRKVWNRYDNDWDHKNYAFGYFRSIRTLNERRANEGCITEYGTGLVRAARNKRNLPNSWDDIYCGAYDLTASWKHNSKRRKQWKPK